jgi:hypothetical protein
MRDTLLPNLFNKTKAHLSGHIAHLVIGVNIRVDFLDYQPLPKRCFAFQLRQEILKEFYTGKRNRTKGDVMENFVVINRNRHVPA